MGDWSWNAGSTDEQSEQADEKTVSRNQAELEDINEIRSQLASLNEEGAEGMNADTDAQQVVEQSKTKTDTF